MTELAEWKARREGPEFEAMRRRLVDAAESIIRDQGASALRLDAVGEAVGLHRSSVYRYFDSKEELFTEVVMHTTLRIGQRVIRELGGDVRPERLLTEGLAMAMAMLTSEQALRSIMAPANSEAMTRVGTRAMTEGIRPLVEPMFMAAERQGLLRPGVSTDDALRWLLVVATGLFRAPDVVDDVDELTRLLELLLLPALLQRPSATSARRSARR